MSGTWNFKVKGEPKGDLDRDSFYLQAIKPEFPDEMTFVLQADGATVRPGTTFSEEGFENLFEQLKTFLTARTLGNWRGTGEAPIEMTVDLRVEFKSRSIEELKNGYGPWYHVVDPGGTPLEGSIRREET
jgi:hypothetical protein